MLNLCSRTDSEYTILQDNIPSGREDGTNSRPGHEDEKPHDLNGEDIPLGQCKEAQQSLPAIIIDDAPMKLEDVELRLNQATRLSLKPKVQPRYMESFTRLWNHAHLEQYIKQQLRGPRGKQMIIDFIQTIPLRSRGNTVAKLKRVWMAGLDPNWPITKDDIGRLPRVGREEPPDDSIVKPWIEAMSRETDVYLRLLWLLDADFGLRPSHICALRWSDVKYQNGHPFKIEAEGEDGRFKTFNDVVAWLPPEVVKTLEEWKKIHPSPTPEALILPFRSTTGRVDVRMQMNSLQFERYWLKLQKKYNLPKLRPKDMRHWIATMAARVGMTENTRAYLQGHDPRSYNSSMGTTYNNEVREKALDEQDLKFPNGALALLTIEVIDDQDGIPPEAKRLLKSFYANEMDLMSLMTALEATKMELDKAEIPRMET